jgi:DnaJ-class molecular chaperone
VVQVFKRNGMDLIMKMDISLTESLCGMKKTIQTLDDRVLVIQTVPGKVGWWLFPTFCCYL